MVVEEMIGLYGGIPGQWTSMVAADDDDNDDDERRQQQEEQQQHEGEA